MQAKWSGSWMWSEALTILSRAEGLQRRFFEVGEASAQCNWEPPIDAFQRDDDLTLVIALPGVSPERVEVIVGPGAILVRGSRELVLPANANIMRLEIPYGNFERQIALPPGRFQLVMKTLANGCLTLVLRHTP